MRRFIILGLVGVIAVVIVMGGYLLNGTNSASGAKPVPTATATATPTATPSTTYIVQNLYDGPHNALGVSLDAECDANDPVTGGGASVNLSYTSAIAGLIADAPYSVSGSSGWHIQWQAIPRFSYTYAVCLDNSPAHVP